MTPKQTLRALDKSIKHWERIVARVPDEKPSAMSCPLCAVFVSSSCSGCPVNSKTGHGYCEKTPYKTAWSEFHTDKLNPKRNVTCAKKELAFLRKVRCWYIHRNPGAESTKKE